MELLINILATISLVSGVLLLVSPARGSFIASIICLGSGILAYDEKSLVPIFIGFALGIENHRR
jgi:hypothetical protein